MVLRFFLYFLFLSLTGYSQNFTLKNVPFRDELNTHLVASVPFFDRDGFIWYKINDSPIFYKYDGKTKIRYEFNPKSNEELLRHDFVYNWVQDNNGKIWAISKNGAYIINPKTFEINYLRWTQQKLEDDFKDDTQISSIRDHKGNIWISIGLHYVLKYDHKYRKTTYINSKLKEKYKSFLIKLTKEDSHKRALIPNSEKGSIKLVKELSAGKIFAQSYLDFYIIDKNGIHDYSNNDIINLKGGKDMRLHCVENGKIFKKNTSGSYYYKNTEYKYKYIRDLDLQILAYPYDNFSYNESKLFTAVNNKIMIFNLSNKYLKIIDSINAKQRIFRHIDLNKNNNVITFSTYDNIYILKRNNKKFKKHLQLEEQKVSTRNILADEHDNLYVGTYSGLFKINGKTKISTKLFDNKFILIFYSAMFLENNLTLWSSDETSFIRSLNLKTNKVSNIKYFGNANFKIRFIKNKTKDSLWIGTHENGLHIFDKKNAKLTPFTDKNNYLEKLSINDVLYSQDNKLWIATEKGLFVKEKGGKIINYGNQNNFFINLDVSMLYEDINKNIWIGTLNKGVIALNTKTGALKLYNQKNGLSNNNVCGILESAQGMWFSTYYGLCLLNKKNKTFTNFYEQDGISDNEFNRFSTYKKNDSTFYFGGLNGITELNPNDFTHNEKKSKIFLSKCEYFSKERRENVIDFFEKGTDIILPYDKNSFVAQFTINNIFDNAQKYFYKIDGLTNGWIDIGNEGKINLYNLPSGKHFLTIKALDNNGVGTVNEIKIAIYVEQVFYKSTLFFVFFFLMTISFVAFFFNNRIRKQKEKYEKEKEVLLLKENALKAQMNPHFVFNILNNIQSVMFLKGEVEANKYFGIFSRLLRLTLDISKQELVSLQDEMEYIKNYLILNNLQMNEQLHFSIEIDESIEDLKLIFIPGMLIQPFVENAIIHGLVPKEENNKKIIISCSKESNYLLFVIEDNGIGRKASSILKKNKQFNYKSWSTTIVNERVQVFNSREKDKVIIKIKDLTIDGVPAGTKVILKFKMA